MLFDICQGCSKIGETEIRLTIGMGKIYYYYFYIIACTGFDLIKYDENLFAIQNNLIHLHIHFILSIRHKFRELLSISMRIFFHFAEML